MRSSGIERMPTKRHDDTQRSGRLTVKQPVRRVSPAKSIRRTDRPRLSRPTATLRPAGIGNWIAAPGARVAGSPAHGARCFANRRLAARTTAVAVGGAGSVHRRTGMKTARALPGDRNGAESPRPNSPSQNRPPTSPVNHIRCSADQRPHRPARRCDAGPDVRRAVGVYMMGRACAARRAPHTTASTQTRPYSASIAEIYGKRGCKMILKEP